MEMSWVETLRLIGLDLQVMAILVLVAFDAIERALHAATHTGNARRKLTKELAQASRASLRIGGVQNV